jgi:hypothetical protein
MRRNLGTFFSRWQSERKVEDSGSDLQFLQRNTEILVHLTNMGHPFRLILHNRLRTLGSITVLLSVTNDNHRPTEGLII